MRETTPIGLSAPRLRAPNTLRDTTLRTLPSALPYCYQADTGEGKPHAVRRGTYRWWRRLVWE
jgi:hypothetical protein